MRRRNTTGRRFFAILLAIMTVMTVCGPTFAATARATTMRLEKTEGTVNLKTANGTARKITQGMRLFNGYTIDTAKESYAYISLDDSKAVKLDASSKVSLRQKSKQLELLVKSGQLFFNVSTPLTDEETMNVRTGTMVTGIRGTSGIVKVESEYVSKLYLLEGKVSFGGENPVTVYGGQIATVQKEELMEAPIVTVADMTETDIPIFAIKEILDDPVLQEKIEETTDLSVEMMEEYLQESLESDEEGTEEGDEETEGEPETPVVPTVPVDPTPEPKPILSGEVTEEQLKEAWETTDEVTLAADSKLDVTESVSVESGKSLIIASGATMNMGEGTTLTIQGEKGVEVNGNITGSGAIIVSEGSKLTNNGTLVGSGLTVAGNASVTNNGLIELSGTFSGAGVYSCDTDALLLCKEKSDALESVYLANAVVGGVTTEYYYAKTLNVRMANRLHESTVSGATTVNFQTNAEVTSDITLQATPEQKNNMQLIMGDSILKVTSGTLTLASEISITGSGAATISLAGGKLVLGESGKVSLCGDVCLQNTSKEGYVISVADGQGDSEGLITWYDKALVMRAPEGSAANTIQGVALGGDSMTVTLPKYVSVADGALEWTDGMLAFMSPELTGTVSAARLQAALNGYDTVTILQDGKVTLTADDTVYVPTGKTLNIESQMSGSDTTGYSGGFTMEKDSAMTVGSGASLQVKGLVYGSGTITVGDNDGTASLNVTSDGQLVAKTIDLQGSIVTNNGIIDIGNMVSAGGSTITNNALIKMKEAYTYKEGATGTDIYTGGEDSVLISNEESDAMPISSKLVVASLKAPISSITDDGTVTPVQYMYADYLNDNVAKYMNNIKTLGGIGLSESSTETIWWNFAKDAVVPANTEITLTNFNAELGTHKIQVEGDLALTNTGTMQGNGDAVIYLESTGTLTLDRDAGNNETGIIQNTNKETTDGYVINVDSAILNGSENRVTWNDTALTIIRTTSNNNGGNVINGYSTGGTTANYISYPSGYSMQNVDGGWKLVS